MGSVVSSVAKDQMSYWQDSYRLPFLLPNVFAFLLLILGIGLMIGASSCNNKQNPTPAPIPGSTGSSIPSAPAMPKKCGKLLLSGGCCLLTGILILITTNIILTVRHPRAAAELAIAQRLL